MKQKTGLVLPLDGEKVLGMELADGDGAVFACGKGYGSGSGTLEGNGDGKEMAMVKVTDAECCATCKFWIGDTEYEDYVELCEYHDEETYCYKTCPKWSDSDE